MRPMNAVQARMLVFVVIEFCVVLVTRMAISQ